MGGTLVGDQRFSTLVAAVTAAGLADTLSSAGPFTVFAPTNDAFAKLPAGTVDSLLQDVPALQQVLLRHVLPSTRYSRALCWRTFTTQNGEKLSAQKDKYGRLLVRTTSGHAVVTTPDITATNGVVHVIDT